ncbi:ATP-binding protein [Amycolatopsis sp. NPDC006131]|uniref:ATP-binding protein n=1 Tax=Amycolatopsis sp. NPDC006131 TaxID=3156731 RepID=UPI00339EC644
MTRDREEPGEAPLAEVRHLPLRRAGDELEPTDTSVLEGELLTAEEYARIQRAKAVERLHGYRRDVVTVARVARTVATHERTRAAGRVLLRHGTFVVAGASVVAKRAWEARSNSRYERILARLEAAGDLDRLDLWEAKAEQAKQRRHDRRMDLLGAPKELAKSAAIAFGTVAGLLLVLGVVLAVHAGDAGLIVAPLGRVVDAITWTYWLVVAYFGLIAGLVTAGGLLYLWNQGRMHSTWNLPAWADPAEPRGEVVNITPTIVAAALRDLGITPLRKAIEADPDHGARMIGMIHRRGPGAQVEITLPPQMTTQKILAVRETLAGNLDRKAHEVHIEGSPDSERVFTLWVADSGALDQNVPPSPLLDPDFGPVDIYRDRMPWGVGLKGDPVELNLLQQHFLLAGLSKQGKTAAARALVLWLGLDPSTRIRIADLKGFGDWSMFEGLAEELIEGAGDENFIATCDMLEWAVAEMQRRYDRWRAMGRKGDIDRASSLPGSGFEPLFIIVDEIQKLFTCATVHPDGGEIGGDGKKSRAARAAQALHDQARAVNIHFLEFAQNPTNRNLPVLVREGAMIRASLYVGTESIAKMALGEAAVDTGAAPHALRAGLDRGTVVLAPGESMDLPNGATHTTVRTHYISTEQAYDIADRAKAFRAAAAARPAARDLLDDVLAVLGTESAVRAADVPRRLRELAPGYPAYEELTGEALVEQLEQLGVKRGSQGGYPMVRTERVRQAIAGRGQEDDLQ